MNRPEPCDVSKWQEILTNLWGKTGDGRPKVRLVWGQKARVFARGAERIKYPTGKFIEKKTYSYHLKDLNTGVVSPTTYKEAVENKEITKLRMSYLEGHEVEWIGEARWFVEELLERDLWGTPEGWEQARYDYSNERDGLWLNKVFIPHLGLWREDRLGPYPKGGRYDFLLRVERNGKYAAPSDETVEEVKKIFRQREEVQKGIDPQAKLTGFYQKVEEYDLIQAERIANRIVKETWRDLRPMITVPSIN